VSPGQERDASKTISSKRLGAWPGDVNLESVGLPAGRHTPTLNNLAPNIRYDALVPTDEPTWQPPDGRLRQR
jgi:hypothetical protein